MKQGAKINKTIWEIIPNSILSSLNHFFVQKAGNVDKAGVASENELSDSFKLMTLHSLPNELMSELPEELLAYILSFVPFKENLTTRLVCHRWHEAMNFKMTRETVERKKSTNKQHSDAIWENQEKEIQFLQENHSHILKSSDADPTVEAQCKKLLCCPTGKSSIAIYAREIRLNALNEAIIRYRIIVSQTKWEKVDKFLPLPYKKLDCRLCYLTRFPQSLIDDPSLLGYWQTLQFLFLSQNQLTSLPKHLNMPLLISLEIDNNKFQFLPKVISTLSGIVLLNVRNNGLRLLPKCISTLPWLSVLLVDNNELSCFPPEIVNLKMLTKIYASKNKIKKLPDNIHLLEKLELLDLSNNDIDEFPESLSEMSHKIKIKR